MSLLKTILTWITGNTIKDIGEAFDKNFTTKEEKLKALAELEQVISKLTGDHDSWLAKNVRPLCLLIALGTLSIIMVFGIEVNEKLQNLYAGWTGTMITLYFGARELVKFVTRRKNR